MQIRNKWSVARQLDREHMHNTMTHLNDSSVNSPWTTWKHTGNVNKYGRMIRTNDTDEWMWEQRTNRNPPTPYVTIFNICDHSTRSTKDVKRYEAKSKEKRDKETKRYEATRCSKQSTETRRRDLNEMSGIERNPGRTRNEDRWEQAEHDEYYDTKSERERCEKWVM